MIFDKFNDFAKKNNDNCSILRTNKHSLIKKCSELKAYVELNYIIFLFNVIRVQES